MDRMPIIGARTLLALWIPVVAAGSASQDSSSHLLSKLTARDSPPLDESLLAAQIGGIVGAYVIFVAILLSLLLFVGRRLRRTVHASNFSLQVEMMKPMNPPAMDMDPSPVTPMSATLPSPRERTGFNFNRSWSSLSRSPPPHSHHNISNNNSVATIDETVVMSDRRRAQEEMEMLYAAVMEHDAQKAAAMETGRDEDDVQSPDTVYTNPFTDRSSRTSVAQPPPSLKSPASPKPPSLPMSPRASSRLSKISSLSLFNSTSRADRADSQSQSQSNTSKLRSPRLNLRPKISISSPMASPDATASTSYGDDQPPLTPRYYNPPPPPAPPMPRIAVSGSSERVGGRAPAPAPLTLGPAAGQGQSPSKSSLPFRDAFPLQSAPATKTTVLERPVKNLNGPRTGMPTPYSPYMPFTPVTPVTPSRMVTKRQRKRENKENGLRVLDENDMVRDEKDVWG